MANPKLIVMLTYQDHTVPNAQEVFDACSESRADIWGFKESGLPPEKMRALFAKMKACGKQTALEVVCYTEEEGLRGAALAAECGCDYLMGTMWSENICAVCQAHGIRYFPFVGQVAGRPSVLSGATEQILAEARRCVEQGAAGIDLLGYRYTGDAPALNRAIAAGLNAPVILAGSVNSVERLEEVKQAGAWAFTIGSAFFDGLFGPDMREAINFVCDYMQK